MSSCWRAAASLSVKLEPSANDDKLAAPACLTHMHVSQSHLFMHVIDRRLWCIPATLSSVKI